ncbi:MAG: nitrate/nitrite transporter [Saprospiraceae bacterium]
MKQKSTPGGKQASALLTLVLAGEGIFLLPFVLARILRPTYLDVFGLTNLQLGAAFSVYGILAMLSYFPGGLLADRFSAKKLMMAAILATALGGALLAIMPPLNTIIILYGFWGVTTILLFWGALIRLTREWGGEGRQGIAFGLLEGGRGLMAAVMATVVVAVFAALLPTGIAQEATPGQRANALGSIFWLSTVLLVGIALLVWFFIPGKGEKGVAVSDQPFSLKAARSLLRIPTIWLQAVIVFCAYTAYKTIDYFSLYASQVAGFDDVVAARLTAIVFWLRPVAAVGAGFLGDRARSSQVVLWSFGAVAAGCSVFAAGILPTGIYAWLLLAMIGTGAAIYALRGVYFALMEEARIPVGLTGTAVGIISMVGFLPDVFISPIWGYLIDRTPGEAGFQQVFGLVAGFAALGMIAALFFKKQAARSAASANKFARMKGVD